jgi:2',3'-cyclic-nucleotide 2'-phosphodiesterase (5'-nucleotidase family)
MQAQVTRLLLPILFAACASTGGDSGPNPFAGVEGLSVASVSAERQAPQFRLLFTGNVNGETEPCGCAVNPKGGLDRRYNYVLDQRRQAKAERPLVVLDAGNALFPTTRLDASKLNFLKDRARLVLKGHALMGMQAQNVGALDLSAGVDFLKQEALRAGVPLVSASWVDASGKLLFEARKDLPVGAGLTLSVIGLSLGREPTLEGASTLPPATALKNALAAVPVANLVVVLSDLGVAQDQELAQSLARPALFIGARDLSSLETPVHRGRSLIVQTVLQGQQWGVLDLAWNSLAEGWFGLSSVARYSDRWKSVSERVESEGDLVERRKLRDALKELRLYAPSDLQKKVVYDHRLVDMTEAYLGKNALTEMMSKVKTPR